jgi:RES domain-containing protein
VAAWADAVVASRPRIEWQGRVWRVHHRRYAATDPGGSLRVSGRYNRGRDRYPLAECWPALYTALAPEVALAEIVRHVTPATLPALANRCLSEVEASLSDVLDARAASGIPTPGLLDDYEYAVPQELACAAIAAGSEALLVPSATTLGDNLIVFVSRLARASTLTVVETRDTHLYVPRS